MENRDAIAKFQGYAEERVVAHLKRFCGHAKIDYMRWEIAKHDGNLHLRINEACEDLAFTLVHDVYCVGEQSKTFTLEAKFEAKFEVPATWLDAFRERFAPWIPNWILRRWKYNTRTLSKTETKTVTHTVVALALLPGVPIRINEKHVEFVLRDPNQSFGAFMKNGGS